MHFSPPDARADHVCASQLSPAIAEPYPDQRQKLPSVQSCATAFTACKIDLPEPTAMPNHRISVRRCLTAASVALSTLLLSAFLFSPVPTSADPLDKRSHPDSAAAVATVAQFRSALAAGDTAAVLSLLSPDVVILENGGVETRSEYRSHHLAADMDFAKALPGARSPFRAVVHGGAAWVSSTSAVKEGLEIAQSTRPVPS